MIDSHCHLTYPQLHDQLDAVLLRAQRAGVTGLMTIGTSAAASQQAVDLCATHPQVRCAIGIHPHHAAEATPADLAVLAELAGRPQVLALGEMGLDYHYDFSPRPRQREVFLAQLELARQAHKPLVIHCREAIDDCLPILRDHPEMHAVFHCFTGTPDEARRILEAGYYLGFTGIVTYKRSDELRRVVAFVPDDRFLVETDAPYLSPDPVRKTKTCEPAFVMHTAAVVAAVRQTTVQRVDELTTANVRRLFGATA
jgi:TatD DNase family protein